MHPILVAGRTRCSCPELNTEHLHCLQSDPRTCSRECSWIQYFSLSHSRYPSIYLHIDDGICDELCCGYQNFNQMPKYSHLNSGANVQDPNLRIDNRVVVRLKCGRAFVCSWSAHADDIRTGIFGLSLSIPIVHTIKIKLIRHLPRKRQMWKGEKVLLMRLLAHSCRVDKTKSGCDIVPRT